MRTTTAMAAIGALFLAGAGAPAMARGYWDGAYVREDPPVQQAAPVQGAPTVQGAPALEAPTVEGPTPRAPPNPPAAQGSPPQSAVQARSQYWGCPCYCPGERRAYEAAPWRGEDAWGPSLEDEEVYTPPEFYESSGGVGPDMFIDETGGGGGGFAGFNGIAVASAFASASANVDIDIRERERFRHDHDMFHDHDMMKHHGYPPMHDFQPHQPMMPMRGWGGAPGWGGMGHMPNYRTPMMAHRGGGRRW